MKKFLKRSKEYFLSLPGLIFMFGFTLFIILKISASSLLGNSLQMPTSTPGHPFNPTPSVESPYNFMVIGISLIFLFSSLWVILSKKYDDTAQNWATTTTGTTLIFLLNSLS